MAGPFGPTDPRSAEERLEDLRRVQRQVVAVRISDRDPVFARVHLAQVQQRRRQMGTDWIQFRGVEDKHGDTTLAVESELLIRGEAITPGIEALFRAHQLQHRAVGGELGERVHRIVRNEASDLDMDELMRLAAGLRRQGVAISAKYVTPMGVYTKSTVASPELSSGGPPQPPASQENGGGTAKSRIRVVIVDTGVWGQRGDGWLGGLQTAQNVEDLDVVEPLGYLDLAAGHGTFTSGIVQQIAPDADIKVVKALDGDGYTDEVQVANAVVSAARQGLTDGKDVIINLSLGTETVDDERPVALSVAMELVAGLQADRASNPDGHEVVVVAAAGNYGHDRPCFPAAFSDVIAVAALTQGMLPADWSSHGAWVDVSTIGEGVRSTFVQGKETPLSAPVADVFPEDAWALWTGTSFAAPQVAGALARIALDAGEDSGVTPRAAFQTLLDGATAVPLYGKGVLILPAI